MKKEDYMKLSKERLAELLAERDSQITYMEVRIPEVKQEAVAVTGFKKE